MKTFLFELCVETLHAAKAAERGGADRIELCSRLDIGGGTPDHGVTKAIIEALSIPVHVLIRPRGGDFAYSGSEFDLMRQQVGQAKSAGAGGVALGVLAANGRVDLERSRELVELARPMKVTFHRAFDETPEQGSTLEAVIETGADCLLTSGGAPDVLRGAESIARLVLQAGDRIRIMAGGGLKLASMGQLLERTGVCYLHGSLTRRVETRNGKIANGHTAAGAADILEADVRAAVELLHTHFAATAPSLRHGPAANGGLRRG